MKKIKLFVDARWFDEFYSGVTSYIKGLYNELIKYDEFEIYLGASNEDIINDNFIDRKFRFIKIKDNKYRNILIEYPRLFNKYKIDIAHFQYYTPLLKPCIYITTIHDLLFLDYPQYFSKLFIINKTAQFFLGAKISDIIFTDSEYSKKAIMKHFKVPNEKIILTPIGVSIDYYKTECRGNKQPYILYVSRIEPRKNHFMLIKAFIELKLYERYQLINIGKIIHLEKKLKTYLNNLPENIKNKIVFIENIEEKKLIEYYQNAALFVYPSFAEGFGIPPIEAIILGTKTICSNSTALKEFDFLDGHQFNPYSLDDIKNKIMDALNKEEYNFDKLRSIIKNRYNWEKTAAIVRECFIDIYNKSK